MLLRAAEHRERPEIGSLAIFSEANFQERFSNGSLEELGAETRRAIT
jgi:hypothetical protein